MDKNLNKKNILLVEDNRADINLIKEAFIMLNLDVNLPVAMDGVNALNFLFKKEQQDNSTNLDLVLLDLNIPRHNGFEVLAKIRKDEKLNKLPVIILTSSRYEEDVYLGYKYKANAVLFKTPDFVEFVDIIKGVYNFWIDNKGA